MKKQKELELYIHIPFCVQKCRYCDFLSAPAAEAVKQSYIEALCQEITEKSKAFRDYQVSTIFIGGGTPTAISAAGIKQIMETVRRHYSLQENSEITMEMNPGTVAPDSLQIYKDAGINRLSIGLQSSEDRELQLLGRIHTWEQFLESYDKARKCGFANINVDIMSALPNQSMESYRKTLECVTELVPPPEHISAYSLIIEEGTPFYEAYEENRLCLPDEETERAMYELTGTFLKEKGYERYEISNYAKPGKECRHNLGYWECANYLGFGIGAASLIENVRFHNRSELQAYLQAPCNVEEEHQILTIAEQMEEMMFLGLRKTAGICLEDFEESFKVSFWKVYQEVTEKHLEENLLRLYSDDAGKHYLALTLNGMDVSNYVMADYLEPSFFSESSAL